VESVLITQDFVGSLPIGGLNVWTLMWHSMGYYWMIVYHRKKRYNTHLILI